MQQTQSNTSAARDPRRWLVLIVLCLSTMVLTIDSMALTVAVPAMTEATHASAQQIQWILDGYVLVFAGLLLTSGSLGDRFGRKRVMLIGLVLFGAASLAGTFANSAGEVIALRVAMGVGGALIMPSTISIMITVFDDEERPKAMGAWTSVSILGLVGAPILGGLMVDHFGWHSIFFLNVPVVALALAAGLTLMPESKAPYLKPDPLGALLSAAGMTSLVWWIIGLPQHGAFGHGNGFALLTAVLSLVGFVGWELKVETPMVPMTLFKARNFSGGSISLALVQIGTGGLMLVLTQYLQFVLGYSPVKAGTAFVPLAVAALIGNTIGMKLMTKVSLRILMLAGMASMVACFVLLTTVTASTGFTVPALALGLLGLGAGLAMPAAVTALMGTIPAERAGVGSALNDTVQQAGTALGVAILGSLLTTGYAQHMPAGAPARAKLSIGDALAVANGDSSLIHAARAAFASAMSTTFAVSAIGVAAAAVLAALVMRTPRPSTAGADDAAAGDSAGDAAGNTADSTAGDVLGAAGYAVEPGDAVAAESAA